MEEREGEMTLLIALALPQASVMPIQHFLANLIEHKREGAFDRGGKTDEVNERSRKGCAALATFILTDVAPGSMVHCSVLST